MMTAAANAPQGRRRKGPRPKHVPQRMCIACRERSFPRTLTRIVRTPEGPVVAHSGDWIVLSHSGSFHVAHTLRPHDA